MLVQSSSEILMVRPHHFGFDPETAETNAFQARPEDADNVRLMARAEFDAAVNRIRSKGVRVNVFEDRDDVVCPDAIFPNNWFSTHKDGTVILYPMLSRSRRLERRQDVVEFLRNNHLVNKVLDISPYERRDRILEGTGSLIFDHISRTIFASRSPRTDENLVSYVAKQLNYESFVFDALDEQKKMIYHTNVMMWIGTRAAAIALNSIPDPEDRKNVLQHLSLGGNRQVFELSHKQILGFAGNCIEVRNEKGQLFLVMSLNASKTFDKVELERLRRCFDDIIVCDVGTIEKVGGGSIRCMIAEINLDRD